jgi:DNA-binding ferritin-like protein (Dps family)
MERALEELCYVYILYFDEERGHMPLLMYPDDELKKDKEFMRPIKYHPVWFLEIEESEALDHIDLEFKGYTFFGKKFLAKSEREKRRAGLDETTPETIVIIISVPNDLNIFGDELLKQLIEIIEDQYQDNLNDLIECELARDEVIKTPQVKKCIEKGDKIKKEMKNVIRNNLKQFFSSVIKERDATSIRKQKAVSFLALKGYDVSYILDKQDSSFSNIKIFDPDKQTEEDLQLALPFRVVDISISEDSDELEILVKNNTEKEFKEIIARITHVKEFFEKEIMNQKIDTWFPKEELLFISPIIPHINEYLFFLIEEEDNKKLLTKKINIDLLKEKAN